jgi:hypothetical protein
MLFVQHLTQHQPVQNNRTYALEGVGIPAQVEGILDTVEVIQDAAAEEKEEIPDAVEEKVVVAL